MAIRRRPPANIERWLWAQLIYIPFIWAAHFAWGDESWQYAAVYCLFTSAILYAVARITLDCLKQHRRRVMGVVIALFLAAPMTKTAWGDLHGRWAWITLAEGFLLLWAGILTSFAGARRPRWDLYVPLGAFWILQGGYSLGWAIHGALWEQWNWVVPPVMGLCCFLYLGWRLSPRLEPAAHCPRS